MKPEIEHAAAIQVPSDWVRRFMALIAGGGRVLDLAAGGGRHVRLLRDAGFRVTAADRDITGLAGFADDLGCEIREVDLESGQAWSLGDNWDGIVVTNYLHRPLFPALAASLAEDGVLIYETFMRGQEAFGKPSNPDFLLEPGELLGPFMPGLTVVAFEQGLVEAPRRGMVQRLAAVRGGPTRLPPAASSGAAG